MPGRNDIPWVVDRAIVFGLPLLVAGLAWHFKLLDDAALPVDGVSPTLWLGLLQVALLAIPATLLHEVGHALAARRILGGDVDIRVGDVGQAVVVKVGGVTTTLNALGDPTRASGVAEFDATYATVDDVILIALAGPAASLVGLLACLVGLPAMSDGFLREIVSAFGLASVFAVLNLLPFRWRERRGAPLTSSDGRVIMDALIVKWAVR